MRQSHVLRRFANAGIAMLGALALGTASMGAAQSGVETIDPDTAIDGDLATPPAADPAPTRPSDPVTEYPPVDESAPVSETTPKAVDDDFLQPYTAPADASEAASTAATEPEVASTTYKQDDLIGAAEGVFGKGAEGLARMIESILKDQGEPNAYIVGREGGGALVIGVRYGSGTLYHKVEGEKPVYWTGPSIGFDAGANAGNTFVLVYNLYDTEDLYKRFPAGEGQAYFIGGLNASYLRRGDIVLIPIRLGAGLRLGVNAGYMKFSKKQRWLPF